MLEGTRSRADAVQGDTEGGPESNLRVGLADERQPHLTQTKKIEMVDEEGHRQDGHPAGSE